MSLLLLPWVPTARDGSPFFFKPSKHNESHLTTFPQMVELFSCTRGNDRFVGKSCHIVAISCALTPYLPFLPLKAAGDSSKMTDFPQGATYTSPQ